MALGGCGSDSGSTGSPNPTSTAVSPVATAPSTTGPAATSTTPVAEELLAPTPGVDWWLDHGFAPVVDEVEAFNLEVTGSIPPSLSGLYVRNGSNPATGSSPHWFLGDGMVHGVQLNNGKAEWYRNRYVRTPYLEGGLEFGEGVPGGPSSQSNVSVVNHAGRLISSGEVGQPYELDPTDLSTIGPISYDGAVGGNFTAHPKVDPQTGLMHAFAYGFVPPFLTYYVISADGHSVIHETVIDVGGPTMMHDFAITDREAIFWEMPVVFDFEDAVNGAEFPFRWQPEYGSRLGVLPLGADASEIKWVEIENGYVFHGTNAWRAGDQIHIDVSRINFAFNPDVLDSGPSVLHRWTIDTSGPDLTWTDEILHDLPLDLPGIDRRFTGRPHSTSWYVMAEGNLGGGVWFPGLAAYDVLSGSVTRWDSGPALQPNEPYFVADSDSAGQGEGWLLSYLYNQSEGSSGLGIFDATDLAAGPVGQILLPQRVPYGFHATWMPSL